MAHRPASTPARTARRTIAQKAPKASGVRGNAKPDAGDDAPDFDDIDAQLDIANALSACGVLDASRNSRENTGRFFD